MGVLFCRFWLGGLVFSVLFPFGLFGGLFLFFGSWWFCFAGMVSERVLDVLEAAWLLVC